MPGVDKEEERMGEKRDTSLMMISCCIDFDVFACADIIEDDEF